MKVTLKHNNDDKSNLKGNRFLKGFILVIGSLCLCAGLVSVFCRLFKPQGYERIIAITGDGYVIQLFFGIGFLTSYYLIQKSKPTQSK